MLVTRYLFKNLFNVTVFVALTLTLVIWLTQSLKLLDLVANSDAPFSLFLKLVALSLPKFLEIILPLSLVTAIIFIYNKFITDNELIVMRACGLDQYALAKPAIIIAVVFSIMMTVFGAWISPRSLGEMQDLRETVKSQYSAFLLREGVFNTFGDNLTVYLKARQENGDMLGLMIYDTREKSKPPVTITAKKGRVVMDGDVPTIVVFEGMRQQLDNATSSLSKLYFSQYTIEIKGLENAPGDRWRKSGERTLPELLNPDMTNKRDRDNRDVFLAEGLYRIITPWNSLSFSMAALTIILLGPFNRRGQATKILFAIGLIITLQALNMFFLSMSKRHLGAVFFVYLDTLLPCMLGFYLLHIRGEQKIMGLIRRWNIRGHKK